MTDQQDLIPLPDDDFRRVRSYLAPHIFATWKEGEPDPWPSPPDLISKEKWDGFITLPTDVALKTTSYKGTWAGRVHWLASEWISARPRDLASAPFMHKPALIATEEFDALVFNAVHGYYRQALGCLRNVLETLAVAASLAVTNNTARYEAWMAGVREIPMREARPLLRDSSDGRRMDAAVAPGSIFGNDNYAWIKRRYKQLCAYTHSAAGYPGVDFWQSNGPIFVPEALPIVEAELRETLALAYLLLKMGWSGYTPTEGVGMLLFGPTTGWGPTIGWEDYKWFLMDELL